MGRRYRERYGYPLGPPRDRRAAPPGGISITPWERLEEIPSVVLPYTLLYSDVSFLTLVGPDVSAWQDAWGLGASAHNATASANRPSFDGTNVVFDKALGERMVWDFSTPEGANDWTWVVGTDLADTSPQYLFDIATGRLAVVKHGTPTAYLKYYLGSGSYNGLIPIAAGPQVLTYVMKATNQGEAWLNNVQYGSGLTYSQKALSGAARLNADYTGGYPTGQAVRFIAVYQGADAADCAAIRAAAMSIMGL